MESFFAAFALFLAAIGPVALLVTKAVDAVRKLDKADNPNLKIVWIGLAFALGVVVAYLFEYNYLAALAESIPRFQGKATLTGTMGQLLTGLSIGGASAFWHGKLDQWHGNPL